MAYTDGKVLWHKGDGDADWHQVELHAVDAAHALEVDGDHWKAEKPTAEMSPEFTEALGAGSDPEVNLHAETKQ